LLPLPAEGEAPDVDDLPIVSYDNNDEDPETGFKTGFKQFLKQVLKQVFKQVFEQVLKTGFKQVF
jgi:hypothetical protein